MTERSQLLRTVPLILNLRVLAVNRMRSSKRAALPATPRTLTCWRHADFIPSAPHPNHRVAYARVSERGAMTAAQHTRRAEKRTLGRAFQSHFINRSARPHSRRTRFDNRASAAQRKGATSATSLSLPPPSTRCRRAFNVERRMLLTMRTTSWQTASSRRSPVIGTPTLHHAARRSMTFVRRSKMVFWGCLLYTSPSPRDRQKSRMPSSA